MFQGKRTKVKVCHESQKAERQENGSIIFETELAGTRDMKFWVMNWGLKAVILELESLRD